MQTIPRRLLLSSSLSSHWGGRTQIGQVGKIEAAEGRSGGLSTWPWTQEVGSQNGILIRVQPRSHRKTVFYPKGMGRTTLVRSPSSKRNNTTSSLYIAFSVSLLSCLSSHVSPQVTQQARQRAGIIISILYLEQAGKISLIHLRTPKEWWRWGRAEEQISGWAH